jgi:hypothetical protein
MLRKISGPIKDDISEQLRTLHNEKILDLCGLWRDAYRILVGKPVGKCPLGRERRWEDNIKNVP